MRDNYYFPDGNVVNKKEFAEEASMTTKKRVRKHVVLLLEVDLGDYTDVEDAGQTISTRPKDYEETFYQSDLMLDDFAIRNVRIEEQI